MVEPEVTAQDIDELASGYRGHVMGHRWDASTIPGPFRHLVIDEGGRWRADGVLRVRTLLRGCVEQFSATGRVQRNRVQATPEERAGAVRLWWGLDEHPCKPRDVVRRRRLNAGEDSIPNWAKQVCGDPGVISHVTQTLDPTPAVMGVTPKNTRKGWDNSADASVRRTPTKGEYVPLTSPQWVTAVQRQWPPKQERPELGQAVSAMFPLRTPPETGAPVGLQLDGLLLFLPPDSGDDGWGAQIRLLRDVLQDKLSDWFSQSPQHSEFVTDTVCRAWSDTDLLTHDIQGKSASPTTVVGDAVGVVAQMLAWSIIDHCEEDILSQAHRRQKVAHALLSVVLDPHDRTTNIPPAPSFRAEVSAATLRATRNLFNTQEVRMHNGQQALNFAMRISGVELFDVETKRELIEQYLLHRPQAVRVINPPHHQSAMSTADQIIGWQCVLLEDRRLSRKHAQAVQNQPAGSNLGYQTHLHRNKAVLANKQGHFGHSFEAFVDGLQQLGQFVGDNTVSDPHEREATLEQLYLGLAGACVRRLETGLLQVHRIDGSYRWFFEKICRAALFHSNWALDCLTMLEKTDLAPNPAAARARYQIANRNWRVQARIIRLRALLGVRTAIEARLIGEKDVFVDDRRLDVPILPLEPTYTTNGATKVSEIIETYCEILLLEELDNSRSADLIPLAAWIAFLNDGVVPTSGTPKKSSFKHWDFYQLLGDFRAPDTMSPGGLEIDVHKLSAWCTNHEADILWLSWVRGNSPVYKRLSDVSGGRFHDFRQEVDPHMKKEWRSHD
ncbi:hypothetical protein [Allobranchiibius sp. CTAmp26]|uniref:hypothetical protein n=1 Tax=Allobranchiibius sp. CTAmp26 TaxID=2815214 RepID=UPI001AA13095|nr:hypothetical protein [Allobranchiibius sp. CTAmp26]MBO1756529.1 hypothetical protein [Allobranchiibius sp. CTAmp26]